jgi:general secretion pathway protein K
VTGRPRERGVALLLAILVVAVLTVIVLPFLYDGRVERAVAANLYTGLQASHLARSGVVFAEALLRDDMQTSNAYDGLDETWAKFNNVPIAAGGGTVAIVVGDEAGTLNVNRLVQSGGGQPDAEWVSFLRRLLTMRVQDAAAVEPLIESLVDWIDGDDRPTGFGGAEAPYYLGLTPPYRPADRPLTTIAELRLVKGWEPKVVEAVAPFVTVYGDGRVNFNTASREVLLSIGLDERQADAVVESRAKTPFKSPTDIRQVPGLSGPGTDNLIKYATTGSAAFSVVATGGFRDTIAVVRAVLTRGARVERAYWRAE